MSNRGSTQTFEAVNESDDHSKDGAFPIGAASNNTLVDSQPSEPISQEKEKKKTPKSRSNSRKGVSTKPKQGKATPSDHEYDPQQFIRRIVYKESDGKTVLGSVHYYDGKTEMFYVVYEDGEEKYVEKSELFNKVATGKEISEARSQLPQSGSAKKTAVEKKKRSASGGEGSAPAKKKGNTSGKNECSADAALGRKATNRKK